MPWLSPRRVPAVLVRYKARRVAHLLSGCVLTALAGCAIYRPQPLHPRPAAQNASALEVPAARMPMPALRSHRFDPSNGLDVTETAMLAVVNNPRLRTLRDRLDIGRAQAFEAGLLPDPQLAASRDMLGNPNADVSSAYSLGLSYDLGPLLTRSARVASARASQRQIRLRLLWAEWQTIAHARLLFDQVHALRAQQHRLQRELTALRGLDASIQKALRSGDLDYAGASAGLDATAQVRNQLADTSRQLDQAESDLRGLLGLAPDAPLRLTGPDWQPRPSAAQVAHAEKDLARRRPDLLALKAGYAAQEARVRAAILGQFPDIQVGFNRARDTSNVHTHGFSIGLTLPLFDGNRGRIAVTRATRQALADAYRARLLATRNDVHRLVAALHTLRGQIDAAAEHAHRMDRAERSATENWRSGALDWPTWLAIRASALQADLQMNRLRRQRAKASIALETLLGGDWTDATTPDTPSPKTGNRSS
ncbi:transporter [Oleiagrimonas sp. MCCC 1A03011]|nr:transporter [Oleiagrimonas sp. MCCC 1A03011]